MSNLRTISVVFSAIALPRRIPRLLKGGCPATPQMRFSSAFACSASPVVIRSSEI